MLHHLVYRTTPMGMSWQQTFSNPLDTSATVWVRQVVTSELLTYLQKGCLEIEVRGGEVDMALYA